MILLCDALVLNAGVIYCSNFCCRKLCMFCINITANDGEGVHIFRMNASSADHSGLDSVCDSVSLQTF